MRANLPINKRRPDPTPSEIRAMCREIQATWSERERLMRAGIWTPPPHMALADEPTWTPMTIPDPASVHERPRLAE